MKWIKRILIIILLCISFNLFSQQNNYQIGNFEIGPIMIVAGVGFFTIGVMAPKSYALGPTGQYYYQPYKFGSRTLGIGTGITLCFIGVFETISEKKKMRN